MPLVAPSTDIFKLWFIERWPLDVLASKMHDLSLQLLLLFFILSIGMLALKSFDGLDIEERIWTFILCGILISLWPTLVIHLKEIVDGFNGYLVSFLNLENMTQSAVNRGFFEEMSLRFSAPALSQADPSRPENQGVFDLMKRLVDGNFVDWMRVTGANFWLGAINSVLSILAITSRFVIQIFFNLYFFLYVLLGPIVIARSIFYENLEGFFELLQNYIVLLLWPTMYVILAGFFVQSWSGKSGMFLTSVSDVHLQLGLAAGFIVMTLLVPPMTKKFATAIGTSIMSPLLRSTGIAIGLTAGQGLLGLGGRLFGMAHIPHFAHTAEKYISMGEIAHEHHKAEHYEHALHKAHRAHDDHDDHDGDHGGHDEHGHGQDDHEHGVHDDHAHESHGHSRGDHGHSNHGHGGHSHHDTHNAGESQNGHTATHTEPLSSHSKGLKPIPVAPPHAGSSTADEHLKSMIRKFQWQPKQKDRDKSVKVASPIEIEQIAMAPTPAQPGELEKNRRLAIQFLAPAQSDKMLDMERLKIRHEDLQSEDAAVVSDYLRRIVDFHIRYGWLYDFDGKFAGRLEERPLAPTEPEVIL